MSERPVTAPFNDAQIEMLTAAKDDRRGGWIYAGDGLTDETYICVMAVDVRWLASQLQQAKALIRATHQASAKYEPWVPCDCEWCGTPRA